LHPVQKPALIGQTTTESIHSGIINGVNFEIDGTINAYKERFGNLITVVTGGDSKNFAAELKNSIFADQNLLLKGLNKILAYHYQNI
jgi:type III pantothenate kinase